MKCETRTRTIITFEEEEIPKLFQLFKFLDKGHSIKPHTELVDFVEDFRKALKGN